MELRTKNHFKNLRKAKIRTRYNRVRRVNATSVLCLSLIYGLKHFAADVVFVCSWSLASKKTKTRRQSKTRKRKEAKHQQQQQQEGNNKNIHLEKWLGMILAAWSLLRRLSIALSWSGWKKWFPNNSIISVQQMALHLCVSFILKSHAVSFGSLKLSNIGRGWNLNGRQPENSGCCWHRFKYWQW